MEKDIKRMHQNFVVAEHFESEDNQALSMRLDNPELVPDERISSSDEKDRKKVQYDRNREQGVNQCKTCSKLLQENKALRNQVSDLSGALIARDFEISTLRKRYNQLKLAVEQQDEVIAKIYAAACPDIDSLQQYTKVPESLMKENNYSNNGTKKISSIMTSKTTHSLSESARDMLEAHLDSMGFQCNHVNIVLESLCDESSSHDNTTTQEVDILNEALDRLLYPPIIDATSSDRLSPQLDELDVKTRSHSCSFDDTKKIKHDFSASAGFLRKPIRRSSGRLSVSDYGLLENICEIPKSNHEECNPQGSSGTLFGDMDGDLNQEHNVTPSQEIEEDHMTYAEFLERISLPASKDILDLIRRFVGSILGPRGDGKRPRTTESVDYEFYGIHEFRRRCQKFFLEMDDTLSNHPVWKYASEATLLKARDGIEKYVMEKLAGIAFEQLEECKAWQKEDKKLLTRMRILSFVTPEMLDIKPCMRNEVVWSMAEDELRRINSYRAPGDKINCIVRCCSIIFSVLNLSRGGDGSRPGADDFLPVFIYIVLHSQIENLASNCEYIAAYRNPADLMSKAGYCFVNLRSAIEFINVLDESMLSIPPDEFRRLYAEGEKMLPQI